MLNRILALVVDFGSLLKRGRRPINRWLQRGYRFQAQGQVERAKECFERVLRSDAENVDAHYLLGALLGQNGQLFPAVAHLARATAINPGFVDAHLGLGNAYLLQGNRQSALLSYQRAAALDPQNALVHSNLGLLYYKDRQHGKAALHFLRALQIEPKLPDLLKNLTLVYIESEQFETALKLLDGRLLENPEDREAMKCKGFVLQKMHRPEQALAYYRDVLATEGEDPETLNNLAIVLQDLGRVDEAIERYDQAIHLQPDFPLAVWHRSLAYLLQHEFDRAWPDYELRMLSAEAPVARHAYPRWDGARGRSVLVTAEQGIGDQIMFASCLPDLIAISKHCIIECTPKLKRLFQRSFPSARVYTTEESSDLISGTHESQVDFQVAVGSLPLYFRRNLHSFPKHEGYLRADLQSKELWQKRLSSLGSGLNVGISWQGGTAKTRSQVRSLSLDRLLPILQIAGLNFVSLQYNAPAAEVRSLESQSGIVIADWHEAHQDYDQTAAMVSALDLVISVCSSVIHLAGALGRPVWVLAPYSPEWRYGIRGEQMPWYPSARIVRQTSYDDWSSVIEEVARKLRATTSRAAQSVNAYI